MTSPGRIFVTGAAGMIGRHLVRKLAGSGYTVVCYDLGEQFARTRSEFEDLVATGNVLVTAGTIVDRTGVFSAMKGAKAVVHLGAMLGVRRTEENRLRCMDINVSGTDNVLSACIAADIHHVVVASSSEVYGEPDKNPIKETQTTKGKTVYAVSKMACEELAKGYTQIHPGLDHTIVRFFNTYGEGQVAQFVLSRFVKQVLEGTSPTVYGTGEQMRSYCHVDDATDGLMAILTRPEARNDVFNIGNSTQVFSLRAVAQKVIDTLRPDAGLSVEIIEDFAQTDRNAEREIFRRYCDTSKAESKLGYAPKITLEEGIRRLAAAETIHSDWPFMA